MAQLMELPEAALAHINSFLDVEGLLSLSQTCKRARLFAQANDLLLWGTRCKDLGVEQLQSWKCQTYRQLYTNVLHLYQRYLGVWVTKVAPYGSVLVVHMEAPCIVGSCLVTKKMNEAVQLRPVFEIAFGDGGHPKISCLRTLHQGVHVFESHERPCKHEAKLDLSEDGSSFCLSCTQDCKQDEFELQVRRSRNLPEGTYVFDSTDISTDDGIPEIAEPEPEEEADMVWQMLAQAMMEMYRTGSSVNPAKPTFGRLKLPSTQSHPLEGLWKGTYGTHGVEVVHLVLEGDLLIGTKLTGDYNVPAGEVTFRCTLSSKEEPLDEQTRFTLPSGFIPRVNAAQLAESQFNILAIYDTEGQVARPGFHSPAFIAAKLFQFSEDCFGILWHSIGTFSLFKRLSLPVV